MRLSKDIPGHQGPARRISLTSLPWDAPDKNFTQGAFFCDLPGVLQNTKTPQVWKYEKNTKKLQNHPFPVWPRKYEKITEKLQKWSFSGQFCNFSVFFFVVFGAKPEMGDFVIFSYFFRISRLEGFLYSVAPQGDHKPSSVVLDREWSGRPATWVGTTRDRKNAMQENFGLNFLRTRSTTTRDRNLQFRGALARRAPKNLEKFSFPSLQSAASTCPPDTPHWGPHFSSARHLMAAELGHCLALTNCQMHVVCGVLLA